MKIENRVRRIYERHPYPPPKLRAAANWTLPAPVWIDAMRADERPLSPKRILIAGCGVGTEAFAATARFPEAEVVAVDFSERSIAAAKKAQKQNGATRIRFDVADISNPSMLDRTGGAFDFISCHGVLSYVPDLAGVFENFARALAPRGVLVAGVNGASHPNVRFRPALDSFGFDLNEFRDSERLRAVLRVCDTLSPYPPIAIADKDPGYVAGDIFGPLNYSYSLAEWQRFARGARLHLAATYHSFLASRALINNDLYSVLMPRSRAEVAALVDVVCPGSFHQLIITKKKPAQIDWDDTRSVIRRRLVRTRVYKVRWPSGRERRNSLRRVSLKSVETSTGVTLQIPQWEVDLLRASDGSQTVQELMHRSVDPAEIRDALYLLYLLGAVNLF